MKRLSGRKSVRIKDPEAFMKLFRMLQTIRSIGLLVWAGKRLSCQHHFRQSEHWYIISGNAVVTKNSKDIKLTSAQAVDLPVRTWYRIQNKGSENIVFIKIQTGDYFKENDIKSSEDDYGRN